VATIEKRTRNGQTTWRVRYRDPGEDNPKSITCPDQKTAKAKAADIDRWTVMNPGVPYPREGPPKATLLSDLCLDYLKLEIGRVCTESTLVKYSGMLDRFLAFIGDDGATVGMLSADLLARWDVAISERGAGQGTRDSNTRLVHAMWGFAAGRPRTYHGVPPVESWTLRTAPRPRTIAPTWAELDACLRHLKAAVDGNAKRGRTNRSAIAALRVGVLCRYTGLRVRQAQSLLWSDFELTTGMLLVREGKTARETAMRREIPISAHLIKELRAWPMDHENPAPPVRTDSIREKTAAAWSLATQEGAVREDVWRMTERNGRKNDPVIHCFRKAFVSGLKIAGADDEAVEYLVGHAPGLRGHYVDPAALPLKEAVALVPPVAWVTSHPS
jgi:integrase